jgi:hypothetical protein
MEVRMELVEGVAIVGQDDVKKTKGTFWGWEGARTWWTGGGWVQEGRDVEKQQQWPTRTWPFSYKRIFPFGKTIQWKNAHGCGGTDDAPENDRLAMGELIRKRDMQAHLHFLPFAFLSHQMSLIAPSRHGEWKKYHNCHWGDDTHLWYLWFPLSCKHLQKGHLGRAQFAVVGLRVKCNTPEPDWLAVGECYSMLASYSFFLIFTPCITSQLLVTAIAKWLTFPFLDCLPLLAHIYLIRQLSFTFTLALNLS